VLLLITSHYLLLDVDCANKGQFFNVLLTLHYFVNKTNLMHNSFFVCLFLLCTGFGQICAHHQEKYLYQYDIWYLSLCADVRQVCNTRRSSTQSDKYQMSYWYNYFSWWWAHSCPKHVESRNKQTKKELCTRLVLFTRTRSVFFLFSRVMRNLEIICTVFWSLILFWDNIQMAIIQNLATWIVLIPGFQCFVYEGMWRRQESILNPKVRLSHF
jgi:hypothetical protein